MARTFIKKSKKAVHSTSTKFSAVGKDTTNGIEEVSVDRVDGLPDNPAYATINLGLTKKLGDSYEFLRIDVSVSKPCKVEDIDLTCNELIDYAAKKLTSETESLIQEFS